MTGFAKTYRIVTTVEIQLFNIVATFTHCPDIPTIRLWMAMQVCFHRRSFADPVKPRWSTTRSVRPLMGTNKAAWGVKLLPLMTVSAYQVDCGSFCALLKTQHCCLPPCGWYCPPSASHPCPPHPPPTRAHPPPI